MRFLGSLFKGIAIKDYVTRLGPQLRSRYGRRRSYTPSQVRSEVERAALSRRHLPYAFAMYVYEKGLSTLPKRSRRKKGYHGLRKEIAAKYFAGNEDFTVRDVLNYADGYAQALKPFAIDRRWRG